MSGWTQENSVRYPLYKEVGRGHVWFLPLVGNTGHLSGTGGEVGIRDTLGRHKESLCRHPLTDSGPRTINKPSKTT